MNMQMIMQQAKKMQAQLQKDQEELEKTEYEGSSSLVKVTINGKYEVLSVNLQLSEGDSFNFEDKDMLEDIGYQVCYKFGESYLLTKRNVSHPSVPVHLTNWDILFKRYPAPFKIE